jgi:hypothetical protein
MGMLTVHPTVVYVVDVVEVLVAVVTSECKETYGKYHNSLELAPPPQQQSLEILQPNDHSRATWAHNLLEFRDIVI